MAELSEPKDSMSTSITGAPAVLGPGDQIEISAFDTPELSQRVRVTSEGMITLALIGEVNVSGMTAEELRELIARDLIKGRYVRKPQISVYVTGYAGQVAYIVGEVNRPGAYPLLRSHRLLDLIAVAGGFSPRAGNTVTISRAGEKSEQLQINLNGNVDRQNNPEVFPGDRITVGQAGIVYVLGEVSRPGGFLIDRNRTISVLQVLALAEGLQSSASIKKAVLIRKTGDGTQQIPVNVQKILKAEKPDLIAQGGDVLYVYGSLTRGLGRSAIITALATASTAAVYVAALH
jgi:polysaccharide export outer membrane protein